MVTLHQHSAGSQALFRATQWVQGFNWRMWTKHKQRLYNFLNPFRENIKRQSLLHFDCHLGWKLCNQTRFQMARWPWQLTEVGVGKSTWIPCFPPKWIKGERIQKEWASQLIQRAPLNIPWPSYSGIYFSVSLFGTDAQIRMPLNLRELASQR